jgi:hypothetical protein
LSICTQSVFGYPRILVDRVFSSLPKPSGYSLPRLLGLSLCGPLSQTMKTWFFTGKTGRFKRAGAYVPLRIFSIPGFRLVFRGFSGAFSAREPKWGRKTKAKKKIFSIFLGDVNPYTIAACVSDARGARRHSRRFSLTKGRRISILMYMLGGG